MDVLVLGWSDIVRRRVVPAILAIEGVHAVHVAGGSVTESEAIASGITSVFSGPGAFEEALSTTDVGLVYVSGRNSHHAPRVMAALRRGITTLVDKPAFLDTAEAEAAFELATSNGALLDEALVWSSHPQVSILLERLDEHGKRPTDVAVLFTIPGPPTEDFRWSRSQGGGVLADMGPYLMSTGRALFGGRPEQVTCFVDRQHRGAVESAATAVVRMTTGGTLTGHLGFGRSYANRITLIGPGLRGELQPAFSGPSDRPRSVQLELDGADESFIVPAADPFQLYLERVIAESASGLRGPSARLLASVHDVELLRQAATESYRPTISARRATR